MGGSVSFQEALAARLGVMQPSRDDLRRFLEHHPPQVGRGGGGVAWCRSSFNRDAFAATCHRRSHPTPLKPPAGLSPPAGFVACRLHAQISLGIPELVALLKAQGKEVFLVSGGFRAVIHPIADVRRGACQRSCLAGAGLHLAQPSS